MPFNGSGVFSNVSGNPVTTGTTISSTVQNNTTADYANAFTDCVTRDGQSPWTANLPAGGFKLTGLAAATANGDAVRYEQIFSANPFTISLTDAGATAGPEFRTNRISASPASADLLGDLTFYGSNLSSAQIMYGQIVGYLQNPTAGAEGGWIQLATMVAGVLTTQMTVGGSTANLGGIGVGALPIGNGIVNAAGGYKIQSYDLIQIGSFTRNIATTGTQVVTFTGATPKVILLMCNINGTSAFSIGMSNGTTNQAIFDDNVDAAGTYGILGSGTGLLTTGGAVSAQVTLGSFTGGSFTATWSKTGSPTGTATCYYMAFF